jgi:polysaccharide pyruvyl transferase WcaK-like protein
MKSKSILIDSDHANARQVAALLRSLDWLVTCRYHALVLAMGSAVPTIGLAHDERITAIMDELGFIDEGFISHEERRVFDLLKEKTLLLRRDSARFRRAIEHAMPGYLDRMAENGRRFAALVKEKFPSA